DRVRAMLAARAARGKFRYDRRNVMGSLRSSQRDKPLLQNLAESRNTDPGYWGGDSPVSEVSGGYH
ncbi:MAG: hypothetical protein WA374_06100, partial [Acidobacteriaceae bacterium]